MTKKLTMSEAFDAFWISGKLDHAHGYMRQIEVAFCKGYAVGLSRAAKEEAKAEDCDNCGRHGRDCRYPRPGEGIKCRYYTPTPPEKG